MFRQLFTASYPARLLVRRAILGAFALVDVYPLDEEIDLDPPPPTLSQTGTALLRLAEAIQCDLINEKDWKVFLETLGKFQFKPRPEQIMKDVDNGLVAIVVALQKKEWAPLTGIDEENITYFATPIVVMSLLHNAPQPQKPSSP